jgi:hypothetical protein
MADTVAAVIDGADLIINTEESMHAETALLHPRAGTGC